MSLSTLYHKDIGFPASMALPAPGALLRYSKHALKAAKDDQLDIDDLPPRLPSVFELIDATVFGGRVARWAVRFPIVKLANGVVAKTGWDAVLVVSYDYTVLTIYINKATDQHATLRRERYARP